MDTNKPVDEKQAVQAAVRPAGKKAKKTKKKKPPPPRVLAMLFLYNSAYRVYKDLCQRPALTPDQEKARDHYREQLKLAQVCLKTDLALAGQVLFDQLEVKAK